MSRSLESSLCVSWASFSMLCLHDREPWNNCHHAQYCWGFLDKDDGNREHSLKLSCVDDLRSTEELQK